ncbi:hypothetical protein KDH_65470 [Dictyobacter sp. S3.2.2.5]|uniref:Activator of Hsp90 ATPase homologue 1/2-like C-terminal domain-containing protein n=1 Tax=Dictyobacter halimunensis TaxID=3026934 RepID=A0ABQ6G4K0_9CHLR|nr:hypothetical protein KDH_65470 [Dictyobacter sp. S3.2.2.5]
MEKTNLCSRALEKDLYIKATTDRVFRALIDKEDLEHWFLKHAEVEMHPGGTIHFVWGTGTVNHGTILLLEPPRRLSYTWESLSPSPTIITFDLHPVYNGTHLHLSHTGIGEGPDWDNFYDTRNKGWDVHLSYLVAWLETGQQRIW